MNIGSEVASESIQRQLLTISNWEHHRHLYDIVDVSRCLTFRTVRHLKYDDVDLYLAVILFFTKRNQSGPASLLWAGIWMCFLPVFTEFLWKISCSTIARKKTLMNNLQLKNQKRTRQASTRNVSQTTVKRKMREKKNNRQESNKTTIRNRKAKKRRKITETNVMLMNEWMNEWMYELNDRKLSCWRSPIGRAQLVVFHLFSSCRHCVQSKEKEIYKFRKEI